ncbi:GntR family transcriptional regulator [Priestia megaterium]|nr:GntR family transcriptional regulator [Priestia megaterium]
MKKNKYLTIYNDLSQKIQKRDLNPNTFLPSENQLVNHQIQY